MSKFREIFSNFRDPVSLPIAEGKEASLSVKTEKTDSEKSVQVEQTTSDALIVEQADSKSEETNMSETLESTLVEKDQMTVAYDTDWANAAQSENVANQEKMMAPVEEPVAEVEQSSEDIPISAELEEARVAESKEAYQRDLDAYFAEKQQYLAQVDEYNADFKSYQDLLEQFDAILVTLNKKRTAYSDELTAFETSEAVYQGQYRDYQKLAKIFAEAKVDQYDAQTELEIKKELLVQQESQVQGLMQSYVQKDAEYHQLKNGNEELAQSLEQTHAAYLQLSAVYEALHQRYLDEEQAFNSAKIEYLDADQRITRWHRLNQSLTKTRSSKQSKEAELENIKELVTAQQQRVDINQASYEFVAPNFKMVVAQYEEFLKRFQETKGEYIGLKHAFDEADIQYNEIKKSYDEASKLKDTKQQHLLELLRTGVEDVAVQKATARENLLPVEQEYQLDDQIFQEVTQSFIAMKALFDNKYATFTSSDEQLKKVQLAKEKVTAAIQHLNERYDQLLATQSLDEQQAEQAKANFVQLKDDYLAIKAGFDPLKGEHFQVKNRYLEAETVWKAAQGNFDEKAKLADATKVELDQLKGWLDAAEQEKAKVEESIDGVAQKITTTDLLQSTQIKSQNLFNEIHATYQENQSKYRSLQSKYEGIEAYFDEHQSLHEQTVDLQQQLIEKYEKVAASFSPLMEQYSALTGFDAEYGNKFKLDLEHYQAEKSYYDRVNVFYLDAQVAYKELTDYRLSFNQTLDEMKEFIYPSGQLSFPINEATGDNYVDEFNIPELLAVGDEGFKLKSTPKVSDWLADFQTINENLKGNVQELEQRLARYEEKANAFLKAGGDRIAQLNAGVVPHLGTEIKLFHLGLEGQVEQWQTEYRKRETLFANVVQSYQATMQNNNALKRKIALELSGKEGLGTIIDSINSLANYSDIYNSNFRNISPISQYTGLSVTELKKPQTLGWLQEKIQTAYFDRINALIDSQVDQISQDFAGAIHDYNTSIAKLKDELKAMGEVTKIGVSAVKMEDFSFDGEKVKAHYQKALEKNTELLRSVLSEDSSLIDVIRRVQNFERIANPLILDDWDNVLAFSDVDLTFDDSQLDVSIFIGEFMMIEAPEAPEKIDVLGELPEQIDQPSLVQAYTPQLHQPKAVEEQQIQPIV